MRLHAAIVWGYDLGVRTGHVNAHLARESHTPPTMLEITDVRYTYGHVGHDEPEAVAGVTLSFTPGQIVGLLGQNGSGKSTLARLLASVLAPQSGSIVVDGIDTKDHTRRWEARRRVGLVFQNPDDQLVTTTLVEEVAFGPENLGLEPSEIRRRVGFAISAMGLEPYIATPLNELSVGQRQQTAIAGVLAMEPRYLVLDEPSSLLPPPFVGRLIATIQRLARELGIGVIYITHHMDEVDSFDRLVVMSHGSVALDGKPQAVFSQVARLKALKLDAPPAALLAQRLRARGYFVPPDVVTPDALSTCLRSLALAAEPAHSAAPALSGDANADIPIGHQESPPQPPLFEARNLAFSYQRGALGAQQALRNLSCQVAPGALVAFVGTTRAGKSTLLDCLNAIIKPGKGMVYFRGMDTGAKGFDIAALRRAIGVVYQSPESQILEDIVGKDVAFSLIRRKVPLADSRRIVQESLEAVGLPYEEFRNRYTYALSGGEKRRVALAGALAARPEALVMDEPMAGLDPQGREEFLDLMRRLRAERAITLVYLSSSLDEVTALADEVYVLDGGSVALQGDPDAIARVLPDVERLGVGLSAVSRLALALVTSVPQLDISRHDLDALEADLVSHLAPVSTLPHLPGQEAAS